MWPSLVPKENFELFPFYQRKEELAVEQGILMWGYKVIVPTSLRGYVLNELHASHLGMTKMKSVARSYFWYPSLDKDIENLDNSCCLASLKGQTLVKPSCIIGTTQADHGPGYM
jgi:hypothetical protein